MHGLCSLGMLRSSIRVLNSSSSHKATAVMTEFRHLVENKGSNLNQLQWRQFFNWVDGDVLASLSATQVGEIVDCLSKNPNQDRFHELMHRFGERVDRLMNGVDPITAVRLARSYTEAGLHVVSPEARRWKKNQVREAQEITKDIVPQLVVRGSESSETDPIEYTYVAAIGCEQGLVDRKSVSIDSVITNGFDKIRNSEDIPISTRAEFAWAVSRLGGHDRISKLFTMRDIQLYEYYKNLVSMPLVTRREWYRVIQLLDATQNSSIQEMVTTSLQDKSTVCGTMASHVLWWRAISGGTFDSVSAQCMQVCMDKADSMSETDKWKARSSLMFFGTNPTTTATHLEKLQFCNRNDILGRPKRSAVAWRRVGNSRISYSVNS